MMEQMVMIQMGVRIVAHLRIVVMELSSHQMVSE